jgi:hypothetical protein
MLDLASHFESNILWSRSGESVGSGGSRKSVLHTNMESSLVLQGGQEPWSLQMIWKLQYSRTFWLNELMIWEMMVELMKAEPEIHLGHGSRIEEPTNPLC